eukprot:10240795-Alexandrium_andersonii.AAC.1
MSVNETGLGGPLRAPPPPQRAPGFGRAPGCAMAMHSWTETGGAISGTHHSVPTCRGYCQEQYRPA